MLASSFEAPRTNTVRLFAVPMRLLGLFPLGRMAARSRPLGRVMCASAKETLNRSRCNLPPGRHDLPAHPYSPPLGRFIPGGFLLPAGGLLAPGSSDPSEPCRVGNIGSLALHSLDLQQGPSLALAAAPARVLFVSGPIDQLHEFAKALAV
jgi:hypothetical protein